MAGTRLAVGEPVYPTSKPRPLLAFAHRFPPSFEVMPFRLFSAHFVEIALTVVWACVCRLSFVIDSETIWCAHKKVVRLLGWPWRRGWKASQFLESISFVELVPAVPILIISHFTSSICPLVCHSPYLLLEVCPSRLLCHRTSNSMVCT